MITFEPPQPFAPGLSSAYGAAAVAQQNLPLVAQQYARNQALQVEAQQQQAALRAQAAQADQRANLGYAQLGAQVGEQGREFAANLSERQHEFAASREPSARDAFLAQVAGEQNRQRAELQAWLSNQEVGQAEQLRLNRMQNSVSEVMADPTLTAGEKSALVTQLRTGIDPIRQRLETQQAQHLQKQNDQIDDQLRRRAEHDQTMRDFEAQMVREGRAVVTMTDDNGRRHVLIKNDRTGEWYNPMVKGSNAGDESRQQAADLKAENDARKEWMHANTEARRELMAKRKETRDEDGKKVPAHPELQDDAAFEDFVFALTGTKLGYNRRGDNMPGIDEHVQLRTGGRGQGWGGAPGAGGNYGGGGDWSGGGQPGGGQPAAPSPAAGFAPYKPGDSSSMNETQKSLDAEYARQIETLKARKDFTGPVKSAAVDSLEGVRVILGRWGSEPAMRAKAQAGDAGARRDLVIYDSLKQFLRASGALSVSGAPRPARPPGGGGAVPDFARQQLLGM